MVENLVCLAKTNHSFHVNVFRSNTPVTNDLIRVQLRLASKAVWCCTLNTRVAEKILVEYSLVGHYLLPRRKQVPMYQAGPLDDHEV